MLLLLSAHEPLGHPAGNGEAQHGAADEDQEDRQQMGLQLIPAVQQTDNGGNEQNRQEGNQEASGILHLLHRDELQGKGRKQQSHAVNGSGNGPGQQGMEQLPQEGEQQNQKNLAKIFHGISSREWVFSDYTPSFPDSQGGSLKISPGLDEEEKTDYHNRKRRETMVIFVILILFLLVLVFRALAVKGRPLEETRHHH